MNSGINGASLLKLGRGTLELRPTGKVGELTGATTIGTTTADGGRLVLGATPALPMPLATSTQITVSQGARSWNSTISRATTMTACRTPRILR